MLLVRTGYIIIEGASLGAEAQACDCIRQAMSSIPTPGN